MRHRFHILENIWAYNKLIKLLIIEFEEEEQKRKKIKPVIMVAN